MRASVHRRLVLLLFLASGFSGLVYEVVWMRLLSLVFGNTAYATAVVLAGFMGGLAVGGLWLGRVADRQANPLRFYAILEFGVAACGLLFPLVLLAVTPLYIHLARQCGTASHPPLLLQAAGCALLVALPAAVMGGTLPVLARHLARDKQAVGHNLGALYGLNTLGAVLGCAAAGLWLIGAIGMRATTLLAVAINAAVGAAALWLATKSAALPREGETLAAAGATASTPAPAGVRRTALALLLVSGFVSMACEVLWVRVLTFLTGGTTIAFTVMLVAYLCGLAAGGLLAARLADRLRRPLAMLGTAQALAGVCTLAMLAAAPALLDALARLLRWSAQQPHGSLVQFAALQGTLAFGVLFPLATLMGICFPLAAKLCVDETQSAGTRVGFAYFADTIGCVAGALLAGFALIPWLGTLAGLACVSALSLLAGATAWAWRNGRDGRPTFSLLRLAVAQAAALALGALVWAGIRPDAFARIFSTPGSRLTYFREEVTGTVTIEAFPDYRTLSINGVNVAGTHLAFETTQKLQAHLALLLHPQARRVLQVGFGSGGTAWAVARHPVERIDCVEIAAAVLQANAQFRDVNHNVLADPRVHVYLDDARSYLVATTNRYDAILSDSIHPIRAGNGGLYSANYFRLCRARLKDDGIFSAWLPIHGLSLEDYRVTVRSLRAVFPHVYLFHTPVGRNEWTIILGLNHPLQFDVAGLQARLSRPDVCADLSRIRLSRMEDLLATFLAGDRTLPAFLGSGRTINTDDLPYLEYVAPRSMLAGTRAGLLLPLYGELLEKREEIGPYLVSAEGDATARIQRAFVATGRALRARLAEFEGPDADAEGTIQAELRAALAQDPENAAAREIAARHPAPQ
jgi:spermidine synthase